MLKRRLFSRKQPPLKETSLELAERVLPVTIQRHPTSRKFSLRILPCGTRLKVVAPTFVGESEIQDFLVRNRDWVEVRLSQGRTDDAERPFKTVPLRGQNHELSVQPPAQRPRGSASLSLEGNSFRLYCHEDHAQRRVLDFLKREARTELSAKARALAEQERLSVNSVRLKDTRSRWGSCSGKGNLNFSWRLIMAPTFVLDYVVAHEVAHLKHLDHSPAFWRYLDQLTPHRNAAEQWLKANGNTLHAFGNKK